jgi:hypothetical protein
LFDWVFLSFAVYVNDLLKALKDRDPRFDSVKNLFVVFQKLGGKVTATWNEGILHVIPEA